jgi:hypothetical protein
LLLYLEVREPHTWYGGRKFLTKDGEIDREVEITTTTMQSDEGGFNNNSTRFLNTFDILLLGSSGSHPKQNRKRNLEHVI